MDVSDARSDGEPSHHQRGDEVECTRIHVVAKLVTARLKKLGVEGPGGEAAVTEFFASVKVRSSPLISQGC